MILRVQEGVSPVALTEPREKGGRGGLQDRGGNQPSCTASKSCGNTQDRSGQANVPLARWPLWEGGGLLSSPSVMGGLRDQRAPSPDSSLALDRGPGAQETSVKGQNLISVARRQEPRARSQHEPWNLPCL